MEHFEFKPSNMVCTKLISFDLDDDKRIHNLAFLGGCSGNLRAISKLVEGMNAEQVAGILKDNKCGNRTTSCADQFAIAILDAMQK